jgi:gamma-glutamyl:cysteine ligase YbdK (ATP-grasp superfamily)
MWGHAIAMTVRSVGVEEELLAVSANSPFWQGRDSAYASFRYQAWSRWPSAGPTDALGNPEVYRQTVRQMVSTCRDGSLASVIESTAAITAR